MLEGSRYVTLNHILTIRSRASRSARFRVGCRRRIKARDLHFARRFFALFLRLPHRTLLASIAHSRRSVGVSFFARALPPLRPASEVSTEDMVLLFIRSVKDY
jgi:hypothetical protein